MTSKHLIILSTCIVFAMAANAQKSGPYQIDKPIQAFYVEGGGPGIFSFNYDQRLKGSQGLGFRVGVGGYGFLKQGVFTVPLGVNYLLGADGSYAEVGGGICPVSVTNGNNYFGNYSSTVSAFINFGYRYQPEKKGLTYRIFISPLFTSDGIIPFYGGGSVGIKF